MLLKRLLNYINPFAHLGKKTYPLLFPLVVSVIAYVVGDIVGNLLWGQSIQRANTMIFITFALIIYFSFRAAIKGGLIVTSLSIIYFSYYIYISKATIGEKLSAIVTASILSIFYLLIALTVGWLRQKIDRLIEQETKARIVAEEAKQRAESGHKRLQAILEQLPVGVFVVTTPNGKTINTNKEITKILGRKPSANLTVKDYGNFKSYASGKNIKGEDLPLAKTLLQGKTIVGDEIVFTDKAKNKKVLLINAAPIQDKNGEIIAGVSTMQDITIQKNLERQKDDLIAATSHELKTPLTSLVVYGQLLERKFSAKNDKQSLDILRQMNIQFQNLTKLITGLLDVNQLERGKLQLHEEVFSMKSLAEEVTAPLQQMYEMKIVIKMHNDALVFADKERIRQVLTNLLTNAIKFSTRNKEVIIRAKESDKLLVVSVQDFGIGIDKEYNNKVFERFFRAGNNRSYPGLGLGLYLSGEIIKQHHQEIWVESEKGKGSTFSFSLQKAQ